MRKQAETPQAGILTESGMEPHVEEAYNAGRDAAEAWRKPAPKTGGWLYKVWFMAGYNDHKRKLHD